MSSPRFPLRWLVLSVLVSCLGLAETALARPWKIAGRVINGDFMGLEGDRVGIRLPSGKIRVVKLDELAHEDVALIKNLLEVKGWRAPDPAPARPAAPGGDPAIQLVATEIYRSRVLQEAQLQVQLAEFWKSWFDIWIVQFDSPQGPYWVWVAARDSETATQLAAGNNPYAQLMFVRRLSRRY